MIDVKYIYNTSDDDIDKDFIIPCLKWAERYDRGVGYFTSGWLEKNSEGLVKLASRGGTIRWIISPMISKQDSDFFVAYDNNIEKYEHLSKILSENIEQIENELNKDKFNVLGWMLYDGLIKIKFAVPKRKLNGDFHDKFGLFYKGDIVIGFSGSNNETVKGFNNYESFKVYKSCDGEPSVTYIKADRERFERLWNGDDMNLQIYEMPEAVKEKIFKVRKNDRPYKSKEDSKWRHQEEAMREFLKVGNGIICMATGTGKTKTAIKIVKKLYHDELIEKVIVTVSGNDLLDQWYEQLIEIFDDYIIFRGYGSNKEINKFNYCKQKCVLVVSREYLAKNIRKFNDELYTKTIIICDEVHGIASSSLKMNLTNKINKFKYRLGLSATPEREYDEDGNKFITEEVGKIIYEFTLEEAIRRGILCKFKYHPLNYLLTDEENEERARLIKRMNFLKNNPQEGDYKMVLIDIARVKKTAINKIDVFIKFIKANKELLKRCIIFVETIEYGYKLQEKLIKINDNYKTYYGDDYKANLIEFSNEEVDYLITSQKISEGVDIKSVENIILFTADKAITKTTQRIGRALRINKDKPDKYANIVDFMSEDSKDQEENSEAIRKEWLKELSKVGWDE